MSRRGVGIAMLVCVVLILATLILRVAVAGPPSPGSKEDPLVTKTYVDWHAVWREMKVEAGGFLKLESGVEFVLLEPSEHPLHLREANLGDTTILDLTSGEPLTEPELAPLHHYMVASRHEARLTVDEEAHFYFRGLKL